MTTILPTGRGEQEILSQRIDASRAVWGADEARARTSTTLSVIVPAYNEQFLIEASLARLDVLAAVENMLRSRAYKFTERRAINRAMVVCNDLPLELPDALIGQLNRKAGCASTVTFDKFARQSDLFSSLP